MTVELPVGYAQVRYGWQLSGSLRPMYSTIACSTLPGDTAQNIANAMDTAFLSTVGNANNLSQGATILPTYVQARLDAGAPYIATAGVPAATNNASSCAPPNVALLVNKRTALGGRRFRGRMFLPALFSGETFIDQSGALSGPQLNTIQPRLTAFRAAVLATGRGLYLLHSPSVPFVLPTEIIALELQTIVGTQRKRLR